MTIRSDNQPHPDAGELVRQAIARDGRITFARFMELAQLGPEVGYFRAGNPTGAGGDYFTAPLAHPAFGALVSLQLRQVWRLLGNPAQYDVVELGAGSGTLGRVAAAFAARFDPAFAWSLRYVAGEAAPPQDPGALQWVETTGVPFRGVTGALVANELLDALPVHRFQIERGCLREIYVTVKDGILSDELGDPSTPDLERYLLEQGTPLVEGFRGEVCLAAERWLAEAAAALEEGIVLLVDYGHTADDLYSPERRNGALRTYFRHTLGSDPYQRVGRQDITTHVNFSHLIRTGERLGLATAGFVSQREFLRNLGIDTFFGQLSRLGLPPHEEEANRYAMRELVRRDGMGDFRVLALSKGLAGAALDGFLPENPLLEELGRRDADLPIPLLGPGHMALRRDRFPGGEQQFTLDRLW